LECRSATQCNKCQAPYYLKGGQCQRQFYSKDGRYRLADAKVETTSGGKKAVVGRVEYKHTDGVFGTTCDDNTNWQTAQVFCKSIQLPYENAELIMKFGGGTGPIYFGNVRCRGTESEIKDCPRY